MKKKKGFTLIEMLGVIIILGILLTLAISSYTIYLNHTRSKTFSIEEKSMATAAQDAYTDCVSNHPNNNFCKNHPELNTKYTYELIYLNELIEDQYIDPIKNPYNTEQFCDIDRSYVYVSSKNNTSENNNSDVVYLSCLICGDHKSKNCLDDDIDYSTFDTTCNAYYDQVGGQAYDGNWTDRTVYLSFGASGNYRYGINEYRYTTDSKSFTSIAANRTTNTASLTLDQNVGNKKYQVQAYDGMNGKGTLVSCGANVKIDKANINSVTITGKTKSGSKVESNKWAMEQVTLTANVNPATSTSGYTYQWYLNGTKLGEPTTSNTLTVQGQGTYQVEVTNGVNKNKKSNEFIVKVDTKPPTCTLAASGTDYRGVYTSNVNITFETAADIESEGFEGSGIAKREIDVPTLTNDIVNQKITGTVTDGVGRTGTCTITITKDAKTPTISAKSSDNSITQSTDKAITDYFNITFGVSGGSTECKVGDKVVTNTNNLQLGVNTVTCTTSGNNGKVSSASTTFKHSYTATGRCSNGTLVNNNACSFTSNASVCGTTCHGGFDNTNCSSCHTGDPQECVGGIVTDYDNCTQWSCVLFKSCRLPVCMADQQRCMRENGGSACYSQGGGEWCYDGPNKRQSGCGTENIVENTLSQCANANSKTCNAYGTKYDGCASRQNTCQYGCDQVWNGCQYTTDNSCTKTSYLSYSCPTNGVNGNTGQSLTPTLGSKVCDDSSCTTIPTCSF